MQPTMGQCGSLPTAQAVTDGEECGKQADLPDLPFCLSMPNEELRALLNGYLVEVTKHLREMDVQRGTKIANVCADVVFTFMKRFNADVPDTAFVMADEVVIALSCMKTLCNHSHMRRAVIAALPHDAVLEAKRDYRFAFTACALWRAAMGIEGATDTKW